MEIKTDSGGYVLKSDKYNCWIEKICKNGVHRLVGGYHKSFNECLKALASMRIKESDADSLKYLLTEIISIEKQLDDIIDKFIPF